MTRITTVVAVLALCATGCGGVSEATRTPDSAIGASSANPGATSPPVDPSAPLAEPSAASAAEAACVSQLKAATHDQLARALTAAERERLVLVVSAAMGSQVMLVFTDGDHDFQCIYPSSPYSDYGEIYAWNEHFPDSVAQAMALRVGPIGGGTNLPTYAWGAFRPPVASIQATRLDPDTEPRAELDTVEAVLAAPYFIALFPEGACCLMYVVGYDEDGNEVENPGG